MSGTDAMLSTAALRGAVVEPGSHGCGRRIYWLSRHWALAVNRKLLAALGLATLAWAASAAVAWALAMVLTP